MKSVLFIAALSIALPTLAFADDRPIAADANAKLGDADLAVVSDLHHANQSEVDMGNYALAHGTKAVKDYAAMMVKDHAANDAKLVAMAKKNAVTKIPAPPADPAAMDAMTKLKAMKGADFDHAYIDMMVADHQTNIQKVTAAMSTVSSPDLQAHLTDTKPALEKHLAAAKTLQSSWTSTTK